MTLTTNLAAEFLHFAAIPRTIECGGCGKEAVRTERTVIKGEVYNVYYCPACGRTENVKESE